MSNLKSNTTNLQSILDTINNLPEAGGINLPELTTPASTSDIMEGKEAIDADGNKLTGTLPTVTQPTPSITVNSSGLITASATQSTSGYVASGTKSATKQLSTQAAKTVTPTKSSQTAVTSGVYTTGAVTVAAIPASYITTTDATATASDIMKDETAYVNGSKVTGTFTIDSELSTQDNLITQIETALEGKTAGGGNVETCYLGMFTDFYTPEGTYYITCLNENNSIEVSSVSWEDVNYGFENVVVGSTVVFVPNTNAQYTLNYVESFSGEINVVYLSGDIVLITLLSKDEDGYVSINLYT